MIIDGIDTGAVSIRKSDHCMHDVCRKSRAVNDRLRCNIASQAGSIPLSERENYDWLNGKQKISKNMRKKEKEKIKSGKISKIPLNPFLLLLYRKEKEE